MKNNIKYFKNKINKIFYIFILKFKIMKIV